jgi:hypothetical protein
MIERTVRQSQTLSPFGVGAIYDVLGESLVAADTTYWKNRGEVLRAPRLERELKIARFKSAPETQGVPYVRFPKWLFCATCRRMVLWRWKMEEPDEPAVCPTCRPKRQLVPMRFVMACRNGHLTDVPWNRWAHSRAKEPKQKQCQSLDLRFIVEREAGAGLETLVVECRGCKSRRSLAGITATGSLDPLRISCPGTQPWQRRDDGDPCDEQPRVLQRGANNLYFGTVRSSIDIPPESGFAEYSKPILAIQSSAEFEIIMSQDGGSLVDDLIRVLAAKLECKEADVRAAVEIERRAIAGQGGPIRAPDEIDLQGDEWHAFLTPQPEHDARDRFITEHVRLLRPEDDIDSYRPFAELIDRVVLATKLREVRALVGFRRYETDGPLVKPDLGGGLDWLPAVEVFGEGIFLSLNERLLTEWEGLEDVQRRAAELEHRRQGSFLADRLGIVTPRFVLLHSLSHLLIRRLAYECGYASASLRERIYSRTPDEGDPQAGLLIYTAAGDAEGTLGGLSRQGEPPRLIRTLVNALQDAVWCSSDPLCRESRGQGFMSLNLAACHACTLASETSCTHSNVLLDRTLVVGTPEAPTGFFSEPLGRALSDAAETVAT